MREGWRENAKGNFTRKVRGEWMTVFKTDDGMWKYVFENEYSRDEYDTAEDAMIDAEQENGID